MEHWKKRRKTKGRGKDCAKEENLLNHQILTKSHHVRVHLVSEILREYPQTLTLHVKMKLFLHKIVLFMNGLYNMIITQKQHVLSSMQTNWEVPPMHLNSIFKNIQKPIFRRLNYRSLWASICRHTLRQWLDFPRPLQEGVLPECQPRPWMLCSQIILHYGN